MLFYVSEKYRIQILVVKYFSYVCWQVLVRFSQLNLLAISTGFEVVPDELYDKNSFGI